MKEPGFWREVTGGFFRWWFAVASVLATFVTLLSWPPDRFHFAPWLAAVLVLLFTALTFLTVSVLYRARSWYRSSRCLLPVIRFTPPRAGCSEGTCHVKSSMPLDIGQVLSVWRTTDNGTACMALVKVERSVLGQVGLVYQCLPAWIAPFQLDELTRGLVPTSELAASASVLSSDLYQANAHQVDKSPGNVITQL